MYFAVANWGRRSPKKNTGWKGTHLGAFGLFIILPKNLFCSGLQGCDDHEPQMDSPVHSGKNVSLT